MPRNVVKPSALVFGGLLAGVLSTGAHAAIAPNPTYSNGFGAGESNPFSFSTSNVNASSSGIKSGTFVLKSNTTYNAQFSATTSITNLGGAQQNAFAMSTSVKLESTRQDLQDSAGLALFADSTSNIGNMYLLDINNTPGENAAIFRIIEVRSSGGNGTPVSDLFTFNASATYLIDVVGSYPTATSLKLEATLRDAANPNVVLASVDFSDTSALQTGQVFGYRGRANGKSTETHSVTATYDNFSVTVPEPATAAIVGVGGAAMLLRRRRQS